MYAEHGLMFPLLQSFPHYLPPQPDDDLMCRFHTEIPCVDAPPHMGNLVQTSTILEYDLGAEGDLFKAPEPIIEEPELALDPMSAAMTIISNGQDVMTETIKVADMESIQNEHLNDVLYECKNELLAKYAINEPFPEIRDVKITVKESEEVPSLENMRLSAEGHLQKSVSSGCLNSMEWIGGCSIRPNFLDFQGMDFEAAFGLRRAYSEGDIQALGSTNANHGSTCSVRASFERQLTISELKTEERKQKLSRYRKKKSKRNFGRKIKYACRKALADSQPRVRGRFAKTEDCDFSKALK
ncbi:uncharacterized protein A4U43_C05F19780 [Asparagus officinalis]|uniref:CCT domain-containing protein n=1 Tax=Asparagus officinalis TaxID=4686 RepID=A0A5P1EXA4_ASPOF|nr:uncharacterized protein LOC109839993 [Asparagus officinalis]ONK69141.1 uncharacterized protein A4U43_C05F19780 [Asparagus officinalis]